MSRTVFLGTGHYVPEKVVKNAELAALMDTSDDWIQQRTGIQERRYVDFDKEPMGASDLGARAATAALADAGVSKDEIDLIIYATLSPDRVFPGDGVLVQAKCDIPAGVPCLDIRNQCSGFLYGLSIADAFIKNGTYKKVLLVGAEVHSTGLDFTTRGRDVAVIFGDGAAAVVLGATDDPNRGLLGVTIHADGRHADVLHCSYPSSAQMPRVAADKLEEGAQFPVMNGRNVFKHAIVRMPETLSALLAQHSLSAKDIDLFVPHQANLRISEFVQAKLELPAEKVWNNIQKYGNTTAASIPLALDEAVHAGKVKQGDLVAFAAFGAGFTWGAALVRW